MTDQPAEQPRREERTAKKHHHKGKSSESLVDPAAILEALRILPGQTILDAGCGDGYMARAFATAVGSAGVVYALDPDEEAIATLEAQAEPGNLSAMVGDITARTPLEDASVDLAYLSTVVHGFAPDQMRGFGDEMVRILKPGARLAIVEIDKQDTPFGPPMNIRFSPEELRRQIPLAASALVRAGEHFYMQVFEKPA